MQLKLKATKRLNICQIFGWFRF